MGSANLNQRSMAVDSEINLATDDPVKAKALRKEVWKMHTEKLDGGNASPSEIAVTFEKWQRLMGDNDREKKAGLPLHGFLCTFRDSKFSKVRYAQARRSVWSKPPRAWSPSSHPSRCPAPSSVPRAHS